MSDFTLHESDTAPTASRPILENIEGAWGRIPNLHRLLAESPATLETYGTAFAAFEASSFTPLERQLVYLAVSVGNECEYCTVAHARLARAAGLDAGSIDALREARALDEPRLEALRRFASAVVAKRGRVTHAETADFLAAGFTRAQVLEVVLAVAVKTISNYVDHVAGVPLDTETSDAA